MRAPVSAPDGPRFRGSPRIPRYLRGVTLGRVPRRRLGWVLLYVLPVSLGAPQSALGAPQSTGARWAATTHFGLIFSPWGFIWDGVRWLSLLGWWSRSGVLSPMTWLR